MCQRPYSLRPLEQLRYVDTSICAYSGLIGTLPMSLGFDLLGSLIPDCPFYSSLVALTSSVKPSRHKGGPPTDLPRTKPRMSLYKNVKTPLRTRALSSTILRSHQAGSGPSAYSGFIALSSLLPSNILRRLAWPNTSQRLNRRVGLQMPHSPFTIAITRCS